MLGKLENMRRIIDRFPGQRHRLRGAQPARTGPRHRHRGRARSIGHRRKGEHLPLLIGLRDQLRAAPAHRPAARRRIPTTQVQHQRTVLRTRNPRQRSQHRGTPYHDRLRRLGDPSRARHRQGRRIGPRIGVTHRRAGELIETLRSVAGLQKAIGDMPARLIAKGQRLTRIDLLDRNR